MCTHLHAQYGVLVCIARFFLCRCFPLSASLATDYLRRVYTTRTRILLFLLLLLVSFIGIETLTY